MLISEIMCPAHGLPALIPFATPVIWWVRKVWSKHTKRVPPPPTKCDGAPHRTPHGHPDPVHAHQDGTWWWYDETWAHEYGPYPCHYQAEYACNYYVVSELAATE